MTDKELKKLGRLELLEILYEQRKQLDEARRENEELRRKLEDTENSLLSRTADMVGRLYEEQFGPYTGMPAGGEGSDE